MNIDNQNLIFYHIQWFIIYKKIEGYIPSTADTRRKKCYSSYPDMVAQLVKQSTNNPKFKGSNLSADAIGRKL